MKKFISTFRLQILFVIFLAVSQFVFAQTAKVIGFVKDQDGCPLSGASVFLKDQKLGTITDSNGRYELAVQTGRQIVIASFTGYSEQEKKIHVKANTITEQDFKTTEVYKECPEVVVLCTTRIKNKKMSQPFFSIQQKPAELTRLQSAYLSKKK